MNETQSAGDPAAIDATRSSDAHAPSEPRVPWVKLWERRFDRLMRPGRAPGDLRIWAARTVAAVGVNLRQTAAGGVTVLRRLSGPWVALYFITPASRLTMRRRKNAVPAQARIIVNPVSGSLHGQGGLDELEQTADWLIERGLPTEVCLTDGPGSARRLAEEGVAAGVRLIVAAGGDGTVNEVIQALANHPATALGVLPMGTVNVWAREVNIPLRLEEARRVLLEGVRRRIDLGRAGNRYFLLMAGIGLDAEVARRVEHQMSKRLGLKLLGYLATAGILSFTQQPARIWMRRDGRRRGTHAVQILIGNTRLYGGALTFTQRAVADDGWLDIVFVGGHRLRHRAHVVIRALLRRPSLGPHAHHDRIRSIRLESATPQSVQVDGEVIGYLPMTFTVHPRALTVVVPQHTPDGLFSLPPIDE